MERNRVKANDSWKDREGTRSLTFFFLLSSRLVYLWPRAKEAVEQARGAHEERSHHQQQLAHTTMLCATLQHVFRLHYSRIKMLLRAVERERESARRNEVVSSIHDRADGTRCTVEE